MEYQLCANPNCDNVIHNNDGIYCLNCILGYNEQEFYDT